MAISGWGHKKGLSQFNPRTNTFKNYKVSDGLQSNEFSVNACVKSPNGEMCFGGNNGFNVFFPDSIKTNLYIPSVAVTNFQIFNKSVPIGKEIDGHVILEKSILETKEIDLSYRENSFLFEFASLDLASPEDNNYAYMLVGFDTTWNYTDAQRRFASYTNMSGGKYVFRVKGSNNDGVWNETGASIRITITPPFWETTWFYIISGVVLISAFASLYRYRFYRVRLNERKLQMKVDERTRELSREIEEHRKTEEVLFLLDTAIQSAANAIVITDREGIIITVNQAFTKITGYSPGDAIGKKTSILKSGNQPISFYQKLWETILSGEVWKGEIENVRKDGSLYTEEMTITPVRQAGGDISHFIAIKQDITERQNLQNQLFQSQKIQSIGTLAGGIAHDFNNVLGGIMGYGEMSLQYAEKNSKLERNLLKILKATDRAKHLIKQILTFSRKTDSQKLITSIWPIINEVLDLLRASIPSSVIIESDLDKNTKPVLADPTKIHEALLNLATNAVHAMDRKGTLTIRLYPERLDRMIYGQSGEIAPGEYTVIEVADTGCGMDAMTLARAFEPFFTTKAVGEGTGMGLSVVLGVVQSVGGDIQVHSEVGKGTTFKLYLPVAEESISEAGYDDSIPQVAGTERVLFVDDEQILVEMAEDMLTSLGYTVICISNSLEALQYIKEKGSDIDILITDQTMPGMTGIELAKEVLTIRNDLPIILCTGFSNELNPERAAAIGVSHIVMKPFRTTEIGKAIRDALDKGRERLLHG